MYETKIAQVQKMLVERVAIPVQPTSVAAQVVLAPTKDGKLGFRVDYRQLNSVAVRDAYQILRISNCIDSVGEEKVLSTTGANSGYWQTEIAPENQEKMNCRGPFGPHAFTCMPFGLKISPVTYKRAIDRIITKPR